MNWLYWKAYAEHTKAAGRARAVWLEWEAAYLFFNIPKSREIQKKKKKRSAFAILESCDWLASLTGRLEFSGAPFIAREECL